MTVYSVKERYFTLQGEGAQTGRAAVFLRFAGCNLWTGLERDRASAVCQSFACRISGEKPIRWQHSKVARDRKAKRKASSSSPL